MDCTRQKATVRVVVAGFTIHNYFLKIRGGKPLTVARVASDPMQII
jgi:hypothetical protein